MAAVLQPGAGHGDVVGGALAFGLDEKAHAFELILGDGLKGLEALDAVGVGFDDDLPAR